jgi:hypothetical protein
MMRASDRKFRSTRRFVAVASAVLALGGGYLAYHGYERLQSPGLETACSVVDDAKDALDSAERGLFRDALRRRHAEPGSTDDKELRISMAANYTTGRDAFTALDSLLRQPDIAESYHYRHDSMSLLIGGALTVFVGFAGLGSLGFYELRSRRPG